MPVRFKLFGPLRDAAGTACIDHAVDEGATVGDVLAALGGEYPALEAELLTDDQELRASVNVTKNGKHLAHLDGLDTAVADGDVLRAAPPVKGG
jgi:molybdopterin synthase sulfur carrier subunit